jgi:hypothetical protein
VGREEEVEKEREEEERKGEGVSWREGNGEEEGGKKRRE